MWVQVGKHSQNMCPSPYVTGKFVTKSMSDVAALHLVTFGTELQDRGLYKGEGGCMHARAHTHTHTHMCGLKYRLEACTSLTKKV